MNFSIFNVLLKNRKFISKIRRSKVTDYAALTYMYKVYKMSKSTFSSSKSLESIWNMENMYTSIWPQNTVNSLYTSDS